MSDNIYNPHGKEIRFMDSNYKELFRIPDGGYITITRADGEQLIRQCKFHGECHVDIGMNLYHIDEFAERMAQNGSKYAPCPEPEIVHGYMITDRMPVKSKMFVMAYHPSAAQKYVTWQGYIAPDGSIDKSRGYDWGHYWNDRSSASTDYFRRADSERTGIPYDHTQAYKNKSDRDNAR